MRPSIEPNVPRRATSGAGRRSLEQLLAALRSEEIAELYGQHTAETGQPFEPAAITRAPRTDPGPAWLVNALARQVVGSLRRDRSEPIRAVDIDLGARALIERQDTHLDSLSARLREPRVRAVIEPMLRARRRATYRGTTCASSSIWAFCAGRPTAGSRSPIRSTAR